MAIQISQDEEREHLKKNGYRWTKASGDWLLIGPTGQKHTKAQALADIKNGTVPVYVPQYSHQDRPAAVRWSQSLVNRPQAARTVLVLDTETSGLGEDAVVLEVSIVDLAGHVVFDSLINPDGAEINPEAAKTHGITNEILSTAPMLADIWQQLQSLLEGGEIVVYNAQFDTRLLKQTAERNGLEMPAMVTHCLMKQYAQFHGELAPGSKDQYRSKKLELACEAFGIVPGGHRALADAEASRQVLLKMAGTEI